MTYTRTNFKTKKELKAAIAAGEKITIYEPSPFTQAVKNGSVTLEGPHYPKPHMWYATAEVKDGYIIKVS